MVFPVNFSKKMFFDKIEKLSPDIIIGLGQHPRARKIRIERRARNIMRFKKDGKGRFISKTGPKKYLVNLKLMKDKNSRISYNADWYVCNYSMYIILDYITRKNKKVRFAFIHFPHNYNQVKGKIFVEKLINEI